MMRAIHYHNSFTYNSSDSDEFINKNEIIVIKSILKYNAIQYLLEKQNTF